MPLRGSTKDGGWLLEVGCFQGKNSPNTRGFPKGMCYFSHGNRYFQLQVTENPPQTTLKLTTTKKGRGGSLANRTEKSKVKCSFRHGWIQGIKGCPQDSALRSIQSPAFLHFGSFPGPSPQGSRWSPAALGCVCVRSHFSHIRLSATPWTVACQAPLSMGLSRQEYGSELPCPPPGDLPDAGTESTSLRSPALVGRFFTTRPPGKPNSR